jgi:hypothetical protein
VGDGLEVGEGGLVDGGVADVVLVVDEELAVDGGEEGVLL